MKRKTMAPTEETFRKWKQEFSWLLFTKAQKLVCALCISQKESIHSTNNFSDTFNVGQCAIWEEEYKKALKEGISVPLHKIVHNVPPDSTISMHLKYLGEKEKQTVEKLYAIAFYWALTGHPFTDFQDQIKLEKLHSVKYTGAYENKRACKDFTFCFSEYFLRKTWKKAKDG